MLKKKAKGIIGRACFKVSCNEANPPLNLRLIKHHHRW